MLKRFLNSSSKEKLALDKLLKKTGGKKVDRYDLYIKDLFEIRNPALYKKEAKKELLRFKNEFLAEPKNQGVWHYFSWLNAAYLLPPEEIYFEIVTARNRPLISSSVQKRFYNFNVGIVGLSIGQSAALTLSRTGGAKRLKLADFDVVSPSNLNRLYLGAVSVGEPKIEEVAKKLYEQNPYHKIVLFKEGLTDENILEFFEADFRLDCLVDACDSFQAKISLRETAKKYKIPLLMATDIGEGVILDVERYDLYEDQEPFFGKLKHLEAPVDFQTAALTLIGPDSMPLPLFDALTEIGRSVPTHPQLGVGANLCGIITALAIKAIASGASLPSERVFIDLERYLNPDFQNQSYQELKQKKVADLKRAIGLKE